MRTITFECEASGGAEEACCAYSCSEAGDLTGAYYPQEDVEGLLSLVRLASTAADPGPLLDLLVGELDNPEWYAAAARRGT